MWEKIKEIKDKHPVVFWVVCLVVFPLGIAAVVALLLQRGKPKDRDLLDAAARSLGQADVHEQNADSAAKKGQQQDKEVQTQQRDVNETIRRVKERAKKYQKETQKIQDADDWDDLDRQAGVK